MKSRKKLLAVLLVGCVLLAGCGQKTNTNNTGGGGDSKLEQPGRFAANTTMRAIQQRGKLVVGLPLERPPFAYKDATTGSTKGFDVEIARLLAAGIFGANIEGRVEFIPLDERDLALALSQNKIDIALGRYAINAQRKLTVDFAGPYFTAFQTIVVANNRDRQSRITTLVQLNGKKICVVRGSGDAAAVKASVPQADLTMEKATVQECGAELAAGTVEAVVAEHIDMRPILGSAQSQFTALNTGTSIGRQVYGIGVSKSEIDLRQYLNDRLVFVENDGRWETAYRATIGGSDQAPAVERY